MVGKDEHADRRTLRGKRRAMAKEKGTVVVQSMVQEAQKAGIPFDYVLFDTWFSNPAQLVALKDIGADVIVESLAGQILDYINVIDKEMAGKADK